MRSKPRLQTGIWPPPPVARRLWLTILAADVAEILAAAEQLQPHGEPATVAALNASVPTLTEKHSH